MVLQFDGGEARPRSMAGKELLVYLRGAFRVTDAQGRDIQIKSKRGAAILMLLCLANDCKLTRSELASYLWKRHDGDAALGNLRQDLAKLQRALRPATANAIAKGNNNSLRIDRSVVWIDVQEERDAIADIDTPLAAWATLQAPLLTCAVELNAEFNERLDDARRADFTNRQNALQRRAQALATARLPDARRIAEFRALAEFDPTDEVFCQQLMLAMASTCSAAEVTRVLKRCGQALAEAEFGVELNSETTAVYHAIVEQIRARTAASATLRSPLVAVAPAGGEAIRVPAEARRQLPSPVPPSRSICVGVRPLRNMTGNTANDLLTAQLSLSTTVDLNKVAGPFAIIELAAAGSPPAVGETLCDYIVAGYLQTGRNHTGTFAKVEYSITSAGDAARSRRNRVMQPLDILHDDRMPLSNRLASKIYLDLFVLENSRTADLPPDLLTRTDLVVRGLALIRHSNTVGNMQTAQRLLTTAVAQNPRDTDALAGIAHIQHRFATQPGFGRAGQDVLSRGRIAIDQVLEIDPEHIAANYVFAMLLSAQGQPDRAAVVFERVLDLTSHSEALGFRGYNNYFLDRAKPGLDDVRTSIGRLSNEPSIAIMTFFEAAGEFHCGDLEQARRTLRKALHLAPGSTSARLWLAGVEHLLGNVAEARALIAEFRNTSPDYSLLDFDATWGTARTSNREYLSRTRLMTDALRALDLPQGP